jgi:alanyl-tRNA synthetase
MEWTSLNDLREKYLSFFESKGHLRLKSFSLVPNNDNSLLLINSGMAPMKKYFTGEITPPRKRVTTCQKCIRTPDIERVGKTARHGTYFEMLGNFSFGDYFKHEALPWAWEFITKVLEMPVDRIWATVYQDDDEAYNIWVDEIGMDPSHIVRLGKEDNFWEHGSGPCGPCSEIYFDRGPEFGCGSPDCKPGCDCDRFMEFWNNVFTQFDNDGNDNYTPLDHPNIDTGMGLERLACIMQGVDNLFEVDTVQNIMKHISRIAGVEYKTDAKKDISLRVITDHIRSTTFMIGDGVMPSNEGRGYVLRRLLRRAARHGRMLGIKGTFLSEVCDTVIRENETAYPELADRRDFIKKVISVEEESFNRTIDQGLQILDSIMGTAESGRISGDDAFLLADTYGFPIDLTNDIAEEHGFTVDTDRFDELMKQQRERARAARKNAGADAWKSDAGLISDIQPTKFVGYTDMTAEAKIVAIIGHDGAADMIADGEEGIILLDTTPFYGEGGGQVGDIGIIGDGTSTFNVMDTQKTPDGKFMHMGKMSSGLLKVGDSVTARISAETRLAVMRNHTAAHLLQAALRSVLGNHVEQAGQYVSADSVRFDFTHFSAMTPDEIKSVERVVNASILDAVRVTMTEMPIDEAKKLGAMALFGEKYGDIVRVVNAEGKSIEFCGGTHVDNTAKIGLFRIISEGSVAAGVRRIEAVTGTGVLGIIDHYHDLLEKSAAAAKAGSFEDLPQRAAALVDDAKQKEQKIEQINSQIAAIKFDGLLGDAAEIDGIKIVASAFWGADADAMRLVCDLVKSNKPNVVMVLASVSGTKVTFAAACGKGAIEKGAHAGNLVREVAKIAGGNGGGRPDSAMAGGKDTSKVDDALAAVEGIVAAQLKK